MIQIIKRFFIYPKTTIYQVFYPFKSLFNLLNIFGFSYISNDNLKTVTLKLTNLVTLDDISITNIRFIDYGNYLFALFSVAYLMVASTVSTTLTHIFHRTSCDIANFDDRMSILKFPINLNQNFFHIIKIFTPNVIIGSMFVFFTLTRVNNLTIYQTHILVLQTFGFVLVLGQYYSFMHFIHSRFQTLAKCFRYYCVQSKRRKRVDSEETFKEICLLYELLNKVFDNCTLPLNDLAMVAIMFYLAFTGFTFFTTYLILVFVDRKVEFQFINITLVGILTITLILLVYEGSFVTSEAQSLGDLVHKAAHNNSTLSDSENLSYMCFSLQILHRFPVPSCGVIDFNWSLLSSIIVTITGWLVVLVQFASPDVLKSY